MKNSVIRAIFVPIVLFVVMFALFTLCGRVGLGRALFYSGILDVDIVIITLAMCAYWEFDIKRLF